MHEGHTIAFQLLHNKTLAAKEAGAQLALEFNAYRYTLGRAEEGILLTDHLATKPDQVEWNDLPRIGRSEEHFLLAAADIGVGGHEQAFTCKNAFAGGHQLAQKTLPLACAITKNGLHLDAVIHHHKGPAFRDRRFFRVQLNLYALHFFADNLVVDFMGSLPVSVHVESFF